MIITESKEVHYLKNEGQVKLLALSHRFEQKQKNHSVEMKRIARQINSVAAQIARASGGRKRGYPF